MVRYPAKIQKEVNDWARKFADPMFKIDWGTIKLSKGNTYSHNLRVCEIALVLLDNDIPFATEVRLKCGARPDIVCPTHVRSIIEVLHSETREDFETLKAHKYPSELRGDWILLETCHEFDGKSIF